MRVQRFENPRDWIVQRRHQVRSFDGAEERYSQGDDEPAEGADDGSARRSTGVQDIVSATRKTRTRSLRPSASLSTSLARCDRSVIRCGHACFQRRGHAVPPGAACVWRSRRGRRSRLCPSGLLHLAEVEVAGRARRRAIA